jgi:hypothetical protein
MAKQRGIRGVCIIFNYVHILRAGFPRVSGVCSIFFFYVVSDGGKHFAYIVIGFCVEHHVLLLLDSSSSPSAVLFALCLPDDHPVGSKHV